MYKANILIYFLLVIGAIGTGVLVVKKRGKEALISLIYKAEYIFDWKKSGKEKLKYVMQQAVEKVPFLARWMINEETISRLVEVLQKDFHETKIFKEKINKTK